VVAADPAGRTEVMTTVPVALPYSIDWLPDGRLLIVSGPEARLLRQEPDGRLVTHAVLSGLDEYFNEIVVDGRGNIYVNSSVVVHVGLDGKAREGGEVLQTIDLDDPGRTGQLLAVAAPAPGAGRP
jgi:sugar lactone lactonase YvrE